MSSSGSARFVTRGRLCLASDGPDLLVGGPTQLAENVVHRAASRRGCGLSWSPSQPKPAALAALWESALNTDDDDLDFSPETMKQLRSPKPQQKEGSCNICLEMLGDDRMGCHGCSMVAHPKCLSRWFNGQPANAKDAIPEAFPSMVKQVERGPCPLCRRELEWNTMVEYVRHIKANKLDVDGKYGEAAKDIVPYSLRSNTAVAARAGALGEVGHVEVNSDQGPHGRRRERRFRLLGNVGVGKRNKRQRLDARREGEDRDAESTRSRESAGSNSRDGGMRSEWSVATNQGVDDSFESLV